MMRTNRRQFLNTALAGGLVALPLSRTDSQAQKLDSATKKEDYAKLDAVLKQPVLKRESVQDSRRHRNSRTASSREQLSCAECVQPTVRKASRLDTAGLGSLYPIFGNALQPFFIGKDARDLDLLLDKVYIYNLNFRLSGMALGIPLATIEFAILDMLGQIAGKSIGQLIGEIHHPRVKVYQATEYREKSVEESLELIKRDVAEYNAHALKIKVGGLMFMTEDINAVGPPGRTETMIPLIRKTFGD